MCYEFCMRAWPLGTRKTIPKTGVIASFPSKEGLFL